MVVPVRTAARIKIDAAVGEGLITLSPLLGTCPRSARALVGQGLPTTRPLGGKYVFGVRPSAQPGGRSRLTLDVLNGAAVVEWTRGDLTVFAQGEDVRDAGTRFAVIVDSAARRGAVFVLEGAVTFGPAHVWPLRAGRLQAFGAAAPVPATDASVAAEAELIDEATFHSRRIWRRFPWWQVLTGAAVVGGVVLYLLLRGGDGGGKSGDVDIGIPL